MSMILLLIGLIVLGKKFAAKTAYCSILLSVALSAMERIWPMNRPLTGQPMLELCFAIALPALGSAILFNIGAYRPCAPHLGCADHSRRLLHLRCGDRALFGPRPGDPLIYDRQLHREL